MNNKKLLKKLSPKTVKILKIVLYILVALILANIFYFGAVAFNWLPQTYYSRVLILPMILFLMGISGVIMPFINQNVSYQANTRNDRVMVYVGIGMIILSLITLMLAILLNTQI